MIPRRTHEANLKVWWNIIIRGMKQSLIEINKQCKLAVPEQAKLILTTQHFCTLYRQTHH